MTLAEAITAIVKDYQDDNPSSTPLWIIKVTRDLAALPHGWQAEIDLWVETETVTPEQAAAHRVVLAASDHEVAAVAAALYPNEK